MNEHKRKVGRPTADRATKQKARRFYPFEKSVENVNLMNVAHANYVKAYGRDSTDAAVLRDALRLYDPKAT